jgi:hypothetical protein
MSEVGFSGCLNRADSCYVPSMEILGDVIEARFPGGKARSGRDADHSFPSSAEVVSE